ncbi:hypothetical protein DRQ20_03060 [bacterium]|nr:MAG: hypothetical protein DRQ20_03060 [bacterium]
MRYAIFLGCTVPVRAQNYEISARKVCEALGIELVDLPQFRCCGYPVKSVDFEKFVLLAARNLAIAEKENLPILTLCNACTVTLTEANEELKHSEELKKKVNEKLSRFGLSYEGKVEVKHIVRVLYELKDKIEIKRKIEGFKAATHYGCHYSRPSLVYEFDDPQYPHTLDELVELTGIEVVPYEEPYLCCGGGLLGIKEDLALRLTKKKLDRIKGKVDLLVSICPFCSIMYEGNQKKIEKQFEVEYGIPVVYYTQLLGLSLGFSPDELGFKLQRIKPRKLMETFNA